MQEHLEFIAAHPDQREKILAEVSKWVPGLYSAIVEELAKASASETASADDATEEPAAEVAPAPQTPAPKRSSARAAATGDARHESAWITGARAYNRAHADLVEQFNAATGSACVVNGEVDPRLVSDWQAGHGVKPDGRIGPKTLKMATHVAKEDEAQMCFPEEETFLA